MPSEIDQESDVENGHAIYIVDVDKGCKSLECYFNQFN